MPSTYATAFAAHHARGSTHSPRDTTVRRGDTMVHRPTMLRAPDTTTTTRSTQPLGDFSAPQNEGSRRPALAPHTLGRGSRFNPGLLRLDARKLHHPAPLLSIVRNKFAELGRRAWKHRGT